MDVLRKELNAFYASQHLDSELLDYKIQDDCRDIVSGMVSVTNAVSVITDAAADTCIVLAGAFGRYLGICGAWGMKQCFDSGDEDIIYNRIYPEDLVEKRMLEYDFFRYVDTLPDEDKMKYVARCRIRIKDRNGKYVYVRNSSRVLRLSPGGKVWLILCCYDLSPEQDLIPDISPRIVNNGTGEVIPLSLSGRRGSILTEREKEILSKIRDGKLSKEIAGELGISINTVNRHRQNILEKLSVNNSMEAVMAATAMHLL